MSKRILNFLLVSLFALSGIEINAQTPNYVRVWEATAPESNSGNLTVGSTLDRARMSTQYLDGLGRPIQTVIKQGSLTTGSNPVDFVKVNDYNSRGAEEYKYLPFAANNYAGNTSISDGMFKSVNPFGQLQIFAQAQYPGESFFYSHTKFEVSPILRPLENYAPGDSYVGTENTSKHGIKINYLTNTAIDNVKIWNIGTGPALAAHNFFVSIANIGGGQQTVTYSWTTTSNMGTVLLQYRTLPSGTWNSSAGSPVSPRSWTIPVGTYEYAIQIWYNDGTPTETVVANSGTASTYTVSGSYGDGELSKLITEDERGYQTIEFKDKRGNLILKKVQLTAQPDNGLGKDYTGWLCTYYIYDDLDHLRCVIQPKGVEAISTSWSLDLNTQTELCFRYEYDKIGRMISKQIPGAQVQYFIYDKRDRLVMTQDGNLRTQSKWLVTLYDELNRAVQTGLWLDSHDNVYHITQAESTSNYYYPFNSSTTPTSSTWDMLTLIHYDDYNGLSSGLSANFLTTWNASFQTQSNVTWPYPQTPAQSNITHNKATYSQSKILNSNPVQYTTSISIYDWKDQVIQVQSQNSTNAIDVVTTQYSWTGQPLVVIQKQQNGVTGGQTYTITNTYTYDLLFRMTALNKSVSGNNNGVIINTPTVTITQNQYNGVGQLLTKKLGQKKDVNGNYTTTELTSLNYDYNIRGWLTGINKGYLSSTSVTSNYFGMELDYDRDGYSTIGTKQFNGNIGAMTWRSQGDGQQRKYEYSYDAANRLLKADFTQFESGGWTNTNVNFNVKMGDGSTPTLAYDANGNILRMQQWALILNTSSQIDDLKYSYYNGGNKLKFVYDDALLNNKLGDFKESSQNRSNNVAGSSDYGYDKNGNLITDLNKNLNGNTGLDQTTGRAIDYNYLNLVEKVYCRTDYNIPKGNIEYVYDAQGNKLKKIVQENVSMSTSQYTYSGIITTTTSYFGSLVYESKIYNPAHPDQVNYADYTNRLKFILTEEGRIRYELANPYTCTPTSNRFVFDYFIKDHLGNIRSVLTDQVESVCYLSASLESGTIDKQKQLYDINDARIKTLNDANIPTAPPSPYPNLFNSKVYETNGSNGVGKKTGLGITLKVMAGDVINITAQSYYDKPVSYVDQNGGIPLTELLNSFVGSNPVAGVKGAVTANDVYSVPSNSSYINPFLSPTPQYNTANAYVNYILFDEQMHYKGGYSDPVASGTGAGLYKLHVLQPVNVQVNGFIYVFVSNESNYPIYFDNLGVTHTPSPILEETHYYPFGLVMKGISSKAAYAIENKFQYNGKEQQNKEFTDGSGLEWQDYGARMYDEQLGRWMAIDPLTDASRSWSVYNYTYNNPLNFVDRDGMFSNPFFQPNEAQQYQNQVEAQRNNKQQEETNRQNFINGIVDLFNNLQEGESIYINVQYFVNASSEHEWIQYNGTQVTVYAGKEGNRTNIVASFKGTSGIYFGDADYRNAKYQDQKDKGPVPEGWYKINLKPSAARVAKADPDKGDLLSNPDGGIEQIRPFTTRDGQTWYYGGWGTIRARLEPLKGTNTYGRDNFYFHNSKKGFSHGCIETATVIFAYLIRYQAWGNSSIKVLVDYPTITSSTYGETDK